MTVLHAWTRRGTRRALPLALCLALAACDVGGGNSGNSPIGGIGGGGGGGGGVPPPAASIIAFLFDTNQAVAGAATIRTLAAGILDPGAGASVDFVAITNTATPVLTQLFDVTALPGAFPFMNPAVTAGPYASTLAQPGNVANIAATAKLPGGVAIGEIDGDALLDLVVADGVTGAGPHLEAVLNDSDNSGGDIGEFSGIGGVRTYALGGGQPRRVILADVDGMNVGLVDLVTADETGTSVTVSLNNGAGLLAETASLAATGNVIDVALGIFNADALVDVIALTDAGAAGQIEVWLNANLTTNGALPDSVFTIGSAGVSIAVANFDGDGINNLSDIVILRDDGNLEIRINDPATPGTLLAATQVATGFGPGQPQDLLATPFSDAAPAVQDLAVIGDTAGALDELRFFVNDGAGVFVAGPTLAVAAPPTAIIAGDFDADTDNDVVLGLSNGSLSLYGNQLVP